MATMNFREPNQVKWIGTRPGHNGTQVTKFLSVTAERDDLHEVTAGKVFYLISWTFSCRNVAAASRHGDFRIYTGAVVYYYMGLYSSATELPFIVTGHHNPPLEVPAGYLFQVYSSGANLAAYASIHGWEE